jgi:hypothetical protein
MMDEERLQEIERNLDLIDPPTSAIQTAPRDVGLRFATSAPPPKLLFRFSEVRELIAEIRRLRAAEGAEPNPSVTNF